MATVCDKESVRQAYDQVRDDKSETNWAVFKYDGNTITLASTGVDYDEFLATFIGLYSSYLNQNLNHVLKKKCLCFCRRRAFVRICQTIHWWRVEQACQVRVCHLDWRKCGRAQASQGFHRENSSQGGRDGNLKTNIKQDLKNL